MVEDRNPLIPIMEDKYKARGYVEKIGGCKLPKLLHWSRDSGRLLPKGKLPERCVIKTNHWSGDTLFIMDNASEGLCGIKRVSKDQASKENGYKVIRNWVDQNGKKYSKWRMKARLALTLRKSFPIPLEWGAHSIKPRGVMIEELLVDEKGELPADWKFHCFHGKVGIVQLDTGRMGDHSQAIYSRDGVKIDQSNPTKPDLGEPASIFDAVSEDNYWRMVETAEKLSSEIDYVRVDLFLTGDEIYFGEFTNYHQSAHPQSDEWEELAGRLWRQE